MAFPQPKPQIPQLPQHLLRTIDCNQGAIRAVRFNGETEKEGGGRGGGGGAEEQQGALARVFPFFGCFFDTL